MSAAVSAVAAPVRATGIAAADSMFLRKPGTAVVSATVNLRGTPVVVPGMPATANGNGHSNGATGSHGTAGNGHGTAVASKPGSPTLSKAQKIEQARQKGYEGDPCGNCQQFTLVRNGTCLKCVSCGETSGCS